MIVAPAVDALFAMLNILISAVVPLMDFTVIGITDVAPIGIANHPLAFSLPNALSSVKLISDSVLLDIDGALVFVAILDS